MARAKKYQVSDGKMVLTLEEAPEGGCVVTAATEPGLITEAETIEQAFEMAREALSALTMSRADMSRWDATSARRLARRSA